MPPRRGDAEGVIDEIAHDLAHPERVGDNRQSGVAGVDQVDPGLGRPARMRGNRLGQGRVEGNRMRLEPELSGPQPGEVHHVAEEQLEAGRLVADDPHGFRLGTIVAGGAVGKGLGIATDGGERRPQLVGHVGQELVLPPAGLGEGPRHVVELLCQVRDLPVALDRHAVGKVSGGDLVGGCRHPSQRRGEPPGDPQRGPHRHEHGHGAGEQHPADHRAPHGCRQADRASQDDAGDTPGPAARHGLGDKGEVAPGNVDGALHRAAGEHRSQVDGGGDRRGDGVVADDLAGWSDVHHPVTGPLEELAEGGGHRGAGGRSARLPGDGVRRGRRGLPLELGEGLLLGVLAHETEGDEGGTGHRECGGDPECPGQASPEAPAPHRRAERGSG